MDRKITIHQPDFIPWLGFFEKIALSDIFVILDDVQFLKRGFHNRDKLIINQHPAWVTVPVQNKGNYKSIIKDIKICYNNNWKKKIIENIKHNYNKSKNFNKFFTDIEIILNKDFKYLLDLNLAFIEFMMNIFNIENKRIIFSSSLNIKNKNNLRILEIIQKCNCNYYITGQGSKDYLDVDVFNENNIKIFWQEDITYFKFLDKFKNNEEINLSGIHHIFCYI
jgi:hypothetical protein